jgi:LysM repeat protein
MTMRERQWLPGPGRAAASSRRVSLTLLVVPMLVLAIAVVAPGAPGAAVAGTAELTHRVRSGESASAIARDYYGDLEAGELLLLYNGKTGPVIHTGDTLKVPYTAVHTIKAGDAWSAIAQKYLGRPAAYPTIARLNGLAPGQPLQVGARILIPAVIPYQLQRGESLSLLADRFYGDHERSGILQQFNGIDDPRRLSPGQALQIPVVSLVLLKDRRSAPTTAESSTTEKQKVAIKKPAPAKTAPEPVMGTASAKASKAVPTAPSVVAPNPAAATTAASAAKLSKPEHRFTRQLSAAERASRNGDYAGARASLEALETRIAAEGTSHDKAEFWRQLTFVYVAFELNDETCTAFSRFRKSAPDMSFDPDVVSPKILRAVSACTAG